MLEHETRDGAETVLHDVLTGRLPEPRNGSDNIAIDNPVLCHSGSFSVVDTTYFGMLLMWSDIGSPEPVGHTGAKIS